MNKYGPTHDYTINVYNCCYKFDIFLRHLKQKTCHIYNNTLPPHYSICPYYSYLTNIFSKLLPIYYYCVCFNDFIYINAAFIDYTNKCYIQPPITMTFK